ncbi:MAG: trypsin-like peptidase domain-containing protein [Eubacterium sp.]|nr:trypsin-like peptidase domain-containing protein [Eubacterium sp.]
MDEKNFEEAAKRLKESEEAVSEAKAEAEAAASGNAETDTAEAEAGPAAASESVSEEPEVRLDDSTQVIDVDYISVDNTETADSSDNLDDTASIDVDIAEQAVKANAASFEAEAANAEGFDADRTTGFDADSTIGFDAAAKTGFDAGNPQYEEHEQSRTYDEPAHTSYAGGGSSDYYSSASRAYEHSQGQAVTAAQVNRNFIRKSTFVAILIIAMLFTMLASVGITTAISTYMNNKTISSMKSSDDHATNYTLTQSDESLSFKSIIQKTQDSVVSITTESVTNDIWMQNYVTQGAGSGVIIQSDGYIITCEHVIEGARKITVTTRDGKEYDAQIIGADPANDIAVIKIDATGLQAATYGDSSKLEVGDTTVVIGNPLGTLSGTATTGIISALDRKLTIDNRTMSLLQTDASINPGNSGGGMFDASGNLIGIVEAKSTGSDIDGLGFATPINKAAKIAKDIIENGGSGYDDNGSESTSGDPKIGIMVTEVDETVAKQYGYSHGGLLVRSVTSTQASLAGLNQGDIIYKADGKNVSVQSDLTDILAKKKAGDKLKLSIAHDDGSTSEVTTILVSERDSNR